MDSFEYSGLWWLSTNQEQAVGGTLSFSPEDGIYLKVMGPIDGSDSIIETMVGSKPVNYALILGVSDKGDAVSLVNCMLTNFHSNSVGFTSQKFKVVIAYIGFHFNTIDDIVFDSIGARFSHLSEWVGVSGFNWTLPLGDSGKKRSYTISYTEPDDIIIETQEGVLKIAQTSNMSLNAFEPRIQQRTISILDTNQKRTLSELSTLFLSPMQNFLTLATNHLSSDFEVVVYVKISDSNDSVLEEKEKRVKVIFQPLYYEKEVHQLLHSSDMLFTWNDIKQYPMVLANWFNVSRELAPVCRWYFSNLYHPSKYTEQKFLSSLQVVELYYRFRYSSEITRFTDILSSSRSLSKKVPSKYYQGIEERLFYFEPSIVEKLNVLLEIAGDVMYPLIKDVYNFTNKVSGVKKYLEYHKVDVMDKSIEGGEIYWLNEALIILMQRIWLHELGLPSDKCKELFEKNKKYQNTILYADFK